MDIIQAQRETRELMVNAQYIVKMMDEDYEGFDPSWAKMRTINARKDQECSICHEHIHYMEPVNVYLSTSENDGQIHRHNMCMNCMTKVRRDTAAHISAKHADQLQTATKLNSTHLTHMTLEDGQKFAAQMQEDAIYLQSHIPAHEILRDGMYLYDNVRAIKVMTKHYCYRCSGRIMPEETAFAVPQKTKRMSKQESNYICQTCASKSLHASSKRIDQYRRERQL
ncbi:hypothetical protein [Kurthia massiliensis]|uniref:hypothetical protein n=1 Tax=Kurthia massiliensis TaxID=1033739 RepID=UPI000287BA6A|nr:hypothetical protein [Kurthia massiliensis]